MRNLNDDDLISAPDEELISDYYACSEEAFNVLGKRWFGKLKQLFSLLKASYQCACGYPSEEDFAQETLLRLCNTKMQNKNRYDPTKSSFESWLKSIAGNLFWDHHRETHQGPATIIYTTERFWAEGADNIPLRTPVNLVLPAKKLRSRSAEAKPSFQGALEDPTLGGLAAALSDYSKTSGLDLDVKLWSDKVDCLEAPHEMVLHQCWWLEIKSRIRGIRLTDVDAKDLLPKSSKQYAAAVVQEEFQEQTFVNTRSNTLDLLPPDRQLDLKESIAEREKSEVEWEKMKPTVYTAIRDALTHLCSTRKEGSKHVRVFHRRKCATHWAKFEDISTNLGIWLSTACVSEKSVTEVVRGVIRREITKHFGIYKLDSGDEDLIIKMYWTNNEHCRHAEEGYDEQY